jgi:hypothetical protein
MDNELATASIQNKNEHGLKLKYGGRFWAVKDGKRVPPRSWPAVETVRATKQFDLATKELVDIKRSLASNKHCH